MFSIQQLLKTIRKLQANGISGGDLVKSLQYAAIACNNNSQLSPTPTNVDFPIWLTSLLSTQGMTSASSISLESSTAAAEEAAAAAATATVSPKQQQQISRTSHEHEITETENLSEDSHCQQSNIESSGNSNRNIHKLSVVSLYSNLNEIGSLSYTENTCTTTQDSSIINTPTIVRATTTPKHFCTTNRSQSIQNFYQQQLHQFHTQHNRSLYSKQKQTQFAMSSLAAEPLSLKSQDDTLANHSSSNGDDAKLNGNETENDSTSSIKSPSSPAAPASIKPCLNTGLAEILQFMELIGNLKHTKRTGWVLRDVNDCESISGHMYRMSMMTFLLDGTEGLNQIRCMELALVHDLAESLVGDITPFCGVSKDEKRTLEFKAMEDICKLIEPRGKRIMELFEEYEHGVTAESKFVKDLDRLDMVMQAFEYEKRDNCLLKHQEFFDSTEGKFQHPFVQQLVQEIYEQRRDLAKAKGVTPPSTTEATNLEEIARNMNGHCAAVRQQPEKTTSTSAS